jgi:membrane-bound lytic murein transglycosylase D
VTNTRAWKTSCVLRPVACLWGLALHLPLTHLRTYLGSICLLAGLHGTVAQNAWPVDSLLSTWPIQQRLQEARIKPRPATPPDTDKLYNDLKREAPALPVFGDSLVDRFVALFATEQRDHFRVLLGVAEAHLPMIERELARHGLPNELKYLPYALSAFNPQAYSNSGEAGLWMLTYPVALKHGLVVSEYIDERRDPEKSTVAAMRHLQDLHAKHGDWSTAVMAFTCGPANLTRARQRSGSDRDPRLLYPHFAPGQRSVLPRLMAFTFLAMHAEKAGLDPLVFRVNETNDTVRFDSTLQINALNRVVGTRPARFRALNPTLTGAVVPAGSPFLLPRSEAQRFGELAFVVLEAQSTRPRQPTAEVRKEEEPIDKLPDGREATLYRIAEGDCLGCIADRFGVGLSELKKWNDLKSEDIELGNTLIIYLPRTERLRYESDTVRVATPAPEVVRNKPKEPPSEDAEFIWYTVRSGDSLYLIAKKYPGVSSDDLMRHNGIGADIRPGQKIKIPKR